MSELRVIQVSDLHLGSAAGQARRREADIAWTQFIDRVRTDPPDLVVVTGDIVVDDPDSLGDHLYARRRVAQLDVQTIVLPGNHDVGDHHVRDGLPADWHGARVSAARVSQWEKLWGPSYQIRELSDWTLIGLNSQLFGSDLLQEQLQWDWLLNNALPRAKGRRCAVFLHEALHLRPEYQPTAPANGWMSIPKKQSESLTDLLSSADIDLIASGHTHRFAQWRLGGLRAVNAPGLVGPIPVRSTMTQPCGSTAPGWVELTFRDAAIEIRHVSRHAANGSAVPARGGVA